MSHLGRRRPLLWLSCCLVFASAIMFMVASPASADPQVPGQGPPGATVNPAPGTPEQPAVDPDSLEANCNPDDQDVPDEMKNTWIGLSPASLGCGAISTIEWVTQKLDMGTSPDVTGKFMSTGACKTQQTETVSSCWFIKEYSLTRAIAVWMVAPIYLLAVIHYVLAGKLNMLLKVTFVFLPFSILGSVVALVITQQLIYITDDISRVFSGSVASDSKAFFQSIAVGFGPKGVAVSGQWFMGVFLALGLIMAGIVLYMILVIREASIYIAALFMPLMLAMLVWPPLQKYFKKLAEFLVGMIISKVVMVAGLSLMVAALVSGSGAEDAAANISLNGDQLADGTQTEPLSTVEWMKHTLTLVFMFFFVCFAPNAASKMFANATFDDTGRNQSSMMNRLQPKRYLDAGNRFYNLGLTGVGAFKTRREVPLVREAVEGFGPVRPDGSRDGGLDPKDRLARHMGLTAAHRNMSDEDVERLLRFKGFSPDSDLSIGIRDADGNPIRVPAYDLLRYWASSDDINKQMFAQYVMTVGADRLVDATVTSAPVDNASLGGYAAIRYLVRDEDGELFVRSLTIHDIEAPNGRLTNSWVDPAIVERATLSELDYETRADSKLGAGHRVQEVNVLIPSHMSDISPKNAQAFVPRAVDGSDPRRTAGETRNYSRIEERVRQLQEQREGRQRIRLVTNAAQHTQSPIGGVAREDIKPVAAVRSVYPA